jgi:hypothetical protein
MVDHEDTDDDAGPWDHLRATRSLDSGPWSHMQTAPPEVSNQVRRKTGPWSHLQGQHLKRQKREDPGPWAHLTAKTKRVQQPGEQSASQQKATASLSSLNFESGHAGAPPLTDSQTTGTNSHYQENGQCVARIKERLGSMLGKCRCASWKTACHQLVSPKSLVALCKSYWALTDAARGHMLRSIYYAAHLVEDGSEDEEEATQGIHNTAWQLCGQQVCLSNFTYLLGTTERTVWRLIYGDSDRRTNGLSSRHAAPTQKTLSIDCFFWELYNSAAEPMPTDPRSTCKGAGQQESSDSEDADAAGLDWQPDLLPADHLTLWSIASRTWVPGLPKREIQHCTVHNLYWQMLACWEELCAQLQETKELSHTTPPAPSWSTFKKRWQHWNRVIKIRKSSSHTQCKICWELQQKMHHRGATWETRMHAAQQLKVHIRHQYSDRTIYWSLRWASQTYRNVLVIIIAAALATINKWV